MYLFIYLFFGGGGGGLLIIHLYSLLLYFCPSMCDVNLTMYTVCRDLIWLIELNKFEFLFSTFALQNIRINANQRNT